MTDKFTESMEVVEVGDLRPSSIGERDDVMRGVLINGVTPDAARMLYKKCEVVPAGAMMEIERLREAREELLDANAKMLEMLKMVMAKLQENHVYKRLGAGFEADDDHRYLADICYELNWITDVEGDGNEPHA